MLFRVPSANMAAQVRLSSINCAPHLAALPLFRLPKMRWFFEAVLVAHDKTLCEFSVCCMIGGGRWRCACGSSTRWQPHSSISLQCARVRVYGACVCFLAVHIAAHKSPCVTELYSFPSLPVVVQHIAELHSAPDQSTAPAPLPLHRHC